MTQLSTVPVELRIVEKMRESEIKAWIALSGYKFWMFGYHAARWVQLNQLLPEGKPNPFKSAVKLARSKMGHDSHDVQWIKENLPGFLNEDE